MAISTFVKLGAVIPLITIIENLPRTESLVNISITDTILMNLKVLTAKWPYNTSCLYAYIRILSSSLAIKRIRLKKKPITDPLFCGLFTQFLEYETNIRRRLVEVSGSLSRAEQIELQLLCLPRPRTMMPSEIAMYLKSLSNIYFGVCLVCCKSWEFINQGRLDSSSFLITGHFFLSQVIHSYTELYSEWL